MIPVVRGRGDYKDSVENFFGNVGQKAGRFLGRGAVNLAERILGGGDYSVKSNSIMTDSSATATFASRGYSTRVSHREYIGDVSGSVGFVNNTYHLNPGNAALFPWLSRLARFYEEYEMHGLVLQFITTSSVLGASGNPNLGAVIMATSYDVVDPAFPNKQVMESYQFSTSVVSSANACHPVECAPQLTTFPRRYTRDPLEPLPNNVDLRCYDMGLFQIATQGQPSTGTIGELWITYDCSFLKPRIAPYPSPSYLHLRESPGGTASLTSISGSSGFVLSTASTLGRYVDVKSTNSSLGDSDILFKVGGTYLITVTVSESGGGFSGQIGFSLGSNISYNTAGLKAFANNYIGYQNVNGTTSESLTMLVTVNADVSASGMQDGLPNSGSQAANILTLNSPTSWTSGTCDVIIAVVAQVSQGSLL